jgi:hypothetical protein
MGWGNTSALCPWCRTKIVFDVDYMGAPLARQGDHVKCPTCERELAIEIRIKLLEVIKAEDPNRG